MTTTSKWGERRRVGLKVWQGAVSVGVNGQVLEEVYDKVGSRSIGSRSSGSGSGGDGRYQRCMETTAGRPMLRC